MKTIRTLLFTLLALAGGLHAQTITTTVADFGSGGNTGQYTSQAIVNGNPAVAYFNVTKTALMYARNSAVDGSGSWQIVMIDYLGSVGHYCSLAVVNGNPAISYYDGTTADLKYVRASDASGTSWGTPVTLDSTGNVGGYPSLVVVNGNPAISYYDQTNADLKYVRASDASGTSWGTPVTVDGAATNVGQYTSLLVINGNPAISYYDSSNTNLKYVRASDASGTSWGTPVALDIATTNVGGYPSLAVVNGNPAISYYDLTNNDLKYVRASDASGTSWATPVTVDGATTGVGTYPSLAVVNGNPAISYYDNTNGDLKYVRASNASGTSWGTPQTLESAGVVGSTTSLLVVNGRPAISYYDITNGDLKYLRASDASGTTWPASGAIADSGFQSGQVGQYASQAIVNGNPAISYYDQTNTDLKYVRANDASGTSWGTAVTLDSTGAVGQYTSLAVINGNPAISYYDQTNFDLKYVRATDASGTSWGAPVSIDTANTVGQDTSLAAVNGNPAICYYDINNGDLKYVRATDASGTSWGTPVTLDSTGNVGNHTSLAVVNGNPAISYYDTANSDLKYVRANDPSGTSWGTALTLDSTGTVGLYTSLAVVNGNPAISYYDSTNLDLKYVRASDASGTSWGTPVTLDSTYSVGTYTSLVALANGSPGISYYEPSNANLKYATYVAAASAPTVSAPTSASVTASTATLGGNVTSDGGATITARGVVFSKTSLNSDPQIGGANVTTVPEGGTTTGVFTTGVSSLSAHTGYTFKAYATNSVGTSYTSAATFTTLNTAPTAPAGSTTGTTGDQQTLTITFPATDADGDAVAISAAASGTGVTVNSFTGTTVTFTPGASFAGSGSFTYTVSDGIDTATGTITVTVWDNDAPVVAEHADVGPVEATSASGAVVTYAAGSATDNVGVAWLIYSQDSGTTFPIGTTPVAISAGDETGNQFSRLFTVTVADTTGPTISGTPANISGIEATGASGAVVTFTDPTAIDLVDGARTVTCVPASGSTFAIGTTTVTCSASDTRGNSSSTSFTVTVQDTTPPVITNVPANITTAATGASGAVVTFSSPLADDAVDGPRTVTCVPASGSTFAIGTTTVTCSASDTSGNSSSATFTVTVTGTANVVHLPDITVNTMGFASGKGGGLSGVYLGGGTGSFTTTGFAGATVQAGDTVTERIYAPAGKVFQIAPGFARWIVYAGWGGRWGTVSAPVTVTLNGSTSGSSSAGFTVGDTHAGSLGTFVNVISTVQPSAAYTFTSLDISFVADATETVPAAVLTSFGFHVDGAATPLLSLVDAPTGNTAPTLTLPSSPVIAEATSASGAVVSFSVSASDAEDGALTPSVSPASGSVFAIGDTTVNVSATDSGSLTTSGSFVVQVRDTTAPTITDTPANITTTATSASGAVVTFTDPTASDLVDGAVTVTCVPASGSAFPIGTTTVTCTATDAHSNSASTSFTVTVSQQSQTISFTLAATAVTTDTIALSASGGESGNAVTFSVQSGPGSIAGNSLTFTAAGSVVVRASQAGNATYLAAADVDRTVVVSTPGGPVFADDYAYAGSGSILIDVLANDTTPSGTPVVTGLTQPASGGTVAMESGKVRFTPVGAVSGSITFTYTASGGSDIGSATVTVRPFSVAAGTYVGLLRRTDTSVRGRVVLTVTTLGQLSGALRYEGRSFTLLGGVNWSRLNLIGAAPLPSPALLNRGPDDALGQPTLELIVPDSVPAQRVAGTLERSPYSASNPAPQAGRYTLVAELPGGGSGPAMAAALTCSVAANGTVKFGGRTGTGVAVMQGGKLLAGGRLPFYTSLGAGAALQRLSGEPVFDPAGAPAVTGTLLWQLPAGAPRVAGGLSQSYDVDGQLYTAGVNAATMFQPAASTATITLTIPSLGAGSPVVRGLVLTGGATLGMQRVYMPTAGGGTGYVTFTVSNGFFSGIRIDGVIRRGFFGVVLNGGGMNEGRGLLLDTATIGEVAIVP